MGCKYFLVLAYLTASFEEQKLLNLKKFSLSISFFHDLCFVSTKKSLPITSSQRCSPICF